MCIRSFQPYAESWFRNVVASEQSDQLAANIDQGDYPDTFGSSLGLNAAGLALLTRASREAGIDANMFSAIQALAEQRVAEGRSADGFPSLIEAIKRRSIQGDGLNR
jgi:3-hydroxyisobutyrate dehydrogenase-like beta-hydroxyacid dehydrogenase